MLNKMKKLKTYITETSKNFTLTDSERDALAEFIGLVTGCIGETKDIKQYKPLLDSLSDEERQQAEQLFDFLDNYETYPKVNRSNMKNDIELASRLIDWAWERDLIDDNWDLQNAWEKLK